MTSRKATLLLCVLFASASLAGASLPRQVRTEKCDPSMEEELQITNEGKLRLPQALLFATACTIGNF